MRTPPLDLIVAARVSPAHEPSAIVVAHRIETLTQEFDKVAGRWRTLVEYAVPTIERFPGGTRYAEVAAALEEIMASAKRDGADRISCAVDLSAAGIPFAKMVKGRGVRFTPLTISEASAVPSVGAGILQIPRHELVSVMAIVLGDRRLQVAQELPHAAMLGKQLTDLKAAKPPRDPMAEWKPEPHTDLAIAAMLAAWWGERMLRTLVKQPPPKREPIEIRPPTFNEALEELDRRRREAQNW